MPAVNTKTDAKPISEEVRQRVIDGAVDGLSLAEIAAELNLSSVAELERYQPDFDRGRLLFTARLRKKIVEVALAGHAGSLRFLAKNLLDLSEDPQLTAMRRRQLEQMRRGEEFLKGILPALGEKRS